MQIYVNAARIQFFALIVYSQGEIPGVKSFKKCSEYQNITYTRNFQPLSDKDVQFIKNFESGYTRQNANADGQYAYVGGQNALPKQLRFIAALGYGDATDKRYLCGGSLISREFVITAAHCLFANSFYPVTYVRLGDLNLTSAEDDQWVQELEVKEYFAPPNYEYPKKYHDLALLKLNNPAVLNEYVQTICLEPQRNIIKNFPLYAAGWGALGYGEEPSSHLQLGELFHYYLRDCHQVYNTGFEIPEGIVDDFQICAGGVTKVSDTCPGDSGGPLFYVHNFIQTLIGITSFGKPCGILEVPGVYTS